MYDSIYSMKKSLLYAISPYSSLQICIRDESLWQPIAGPHPDGQHLHEDSPKRQKSFTLTAKAYTALLRDESPPDGSLWHPLSGLHPDG